MHFKAQFSHKSVKKPQALWHATLRYLGWMGRLTEETPLWSGTALPQVTGLRGFRSWDLIGIYKLGDVGEGAR